MPVPCNDTPAQRLLPVALSIVFVIYVIIGIVVAWTRSYITIGLIKGVLSAVLAIFLWFLPLLGVSLHLH